MVDTALLADDAVTVQVDVAGTIEKATISRRALYDPSGSRMRA